MDAATQMNKGGYKQELEFHLVGKGLYSNISHPQLRNQISYFMVLLMMPN